MQGVSNEGKLNKPLQLYTVSQVVKRLVNFTEFSEDGITV